MQNYIRIKPSWQIFTQNNSLVFYNSYGKEVSFMLSHVMKTVLHLLSTSITETQLIARLVKKIRADKTNVIALIEKMKSLHILESYIPDQIESEAYQKFQTQFSFFDLLKPTATLQLKIDLHKKLEAIKIMVIGCGGIGCTLLQSIAAVGVQQIIIVDGDKVEISNLSKQLLFTRKDIDAYKTVAAKKQLRRIAPEATILPITTFINGANQLEEIIKKKSKPDFIFLSADDLMLPIWLDEVCEKYNIPFMKVSYLGTVGFIGPLIAPGQKRFSEVIDTSFITQLENEVTALHNANHKHASTVFTNSIIANMAITESLKFLLKTGDPKTISRRLYFNFQTMESFYDDDFADH